jgi:predicted porin
MKKSLLSTAILLSLAGGAQAQMTIYGLLDGSYGKSIYDDLPVHGAAGNQSLKADFHSGGDDGSGQGNSTSRFGIKGTTDVGSGIKANFNLQSSGITSSGSVNDPFFGRQAWFGFSGGFGEFRFGRQDSIPFQTMIDFDFNGASNGISAGAYSGVGAFGAKIGRQSRSLQYIAPEFVKGAKLQLGFVPEGNVPGDKATYSAGVTYTAGPLSVAGAYESKRTETSAQFGSISASYDLTVAKFMLGYTKNGSSVKGFNVGVTAPVAGFTVGALYGKNSSDTDKSKAYELFVNKEVLKGTYAYAEYGSADMKGTQTVVGSFPTATKGSGFAVGMIYTF